MSSAVPPLASRPSPEALLNNLARGPRQDRLTHVHRVPARSASPAPWPDWVTPTLYAALTQAGLANLWSHQLEAAEAAHAGAHVVLSTGYRLGQVARLPAACALRRRGRLPRAERAGARPRSTSRRPRPSPTTSSTASTGWPCRGCGPRPTTATPRPRTGGGSGSTPTTSSPTRTCSTTPSCRVTSTGRRSSGRSGTSSSTSATSTGASSGPTSRWCCAGCGGCARGTGPRPPSCSPRRRWPTQRSTPAGSSVCPCRRSPRTARHGRRSPSGCGSPARRGTGRRPGRPDLPAPQRSRPTALPTSTRPDRP